MCVSAVDGCAFLVCAVGWCGLLYVWLFAVVCMCVCVGHVVVC